jgi:DNA-binding transcriptional LysR family regulator
MEFRQLRTFRAVADHLSFSKAAGQLFMAQSSVSAQIRLLEEELDLKLFDRLGRRVVLTDAGQKLYAYARRIEEMTHEIRSEVTGAKNALGALTIRVPETLAAVYMPCVVDRFCRDNPKVKLNFINCTDFQLREELNSGRIDLAFLMTDAVHFKEVNVELLGTEELILVAAPAHPLCKKNEITLHDLSGQTILLSKTDCSYRKAFERLLEEQKIKSHKLEFSSINGMRNCLKLSLGYTICPHVSVRRELEDGSLSRLSWHAAPFETSIVMIWHAEKWCSPLLKHFMALTRETISDNCWAKTQQSY